VGEKGVISPPQKDRLLPLSHAEACKMALSARENQPMKSGVQKGGTKSVAIFNCIGAAFATTDITCEEREAPLWDINNLMSLNIDLNSQPRLQT
jgi:hypothetical protein